MNKSMFHLIMALALYAIATVLTFAWFGWKLALILFLVLWAHNSEEAGKRCVATT